MALHESWLPVKEFHGYEVSDIGRVRRGPRLKAQTLNAKGYFCVSFWTASGSRKRTVHKLVAEAFHGDRLPGQLIRHINGVKTDNRAENLVYGSYVENEADKDLHGTKVWGTRHYKSKLSELQVREIRTRYADRSNVVSLSRLSMQYGVATKTIHAIVQGKTWKNLL